jgi:hypothetical protein
MFKLYEKQGNKLPNGWRLSGLATFRFIVTILSGK